MVEGDVVDLENNNENQHDSVANSETNGRETLERKGTALNIIEKFLKRVRNDTKNAGFRPSIPFVNEVNEALEAVLT